MSAYEGLKQLCYDRMITGEDIELILAAYADAVEQEEPHAVSEIDAARNIGMNIRDILEDMA